MRFNRSLNLGLLALLAVSPVALHAQDTKGWVGVVITTGIGTMNESGAMLFNDYPTIESIDPGSPAEKAGLQAGDVLISINRQDFKRNPIPMGSLLAPGNRVVFRYMRNDVARTVSMQVVERPSDSRAYVELKLIEPVPSQNPNMIQRKNTELLNRNVVVRPTREPIVSVAPLVIGSGTPTLRLLGAQLTELNEGLRSALNMKGPGVLVINVAVGTPANFSGLRGGDVIVEAGKESIANPGELIRLIRSSVEQSIELRVMRKQKAQNITLRW
jgi:serine protease Do